MANTLEILMLLSFGASWPINFAKALKSGTTKGTSLTFLILIEFGYICGIVAKFLNDSTNYVLFFYAINLIIVAMNIGVYFVNRKKDNSRYKHTSS